MGLTQPAWLLLLVIVGALVAGYALFLARRRRDVVRFTALDLLDTVAPRRPGWTKHLPTIAIVAALVLLIIGLAGPTALAKVPPNRATVMLIIDVSLSMQAEDVEPSRLVAAQTAAKEFSDELPSTINLGLVAFAGTAAVLVSPTTDRAAVERAIDNLRLAESTATGEGIFAALQSIESFSQALAGIQEGPSPAHIVLMSDGKQTVPGPDGENEPRGAFTAARKAAELGIPISTIAFGTDYAFVDNNLSDVRPDECIDRMYF
jgi:Ca-activated chloride channel homolog